MMNSVDHKMQKKKEENRERCVTLEINSKININLSQFCVIKKKTPIKNCVICKCRSISIQLTSFQMHKFSRSWN